MSLYGRTDSNANKTKAGVGIAASSQAKTTLYIDETEAALEANKERGLNAPGWWSYYSYTDASGATRHKAEQLVFVAGGDINDNETQADDAQAADVAVLITINEQPALTKAVILGEALNLAVDAIASPPGDASVLTYQWQKKSGRRWTNVGVNTPTYDVPTYAETDAGEYRVKITSTNGAPEVISDTSTVITAE